MAVRRYFLKEPGKSFFEAFVRAYAMTHAIGTSRQWGKKEPSESLVHQVLEHLKTSGTGHGLFGDYAAFLPKLPNGEDYGNYRSKRDAQGNLLGSTKAEPMEAIAMLLWRLQSLDSAADSKASELRRKWDELAPSDHPPLQTVQEAMRALCSASTETRGSHAAPPKATATALDRHPFCVGRKAELAEIADALAVPGSRWLITAKAGVGKSAVMAEAIRRNLDGKGIAWHVFESGQQTAKVQSFVQSLKRGWKLPVTVRNLEDVLAAIAKERRTTYGLIVDAFDECEDLNAFGKFFIDLPKSVSLVGSVRAGEQDLELNVPVGLGVHSDRFPLAHLEDARDIAEWICCLAESQGVARAVGPNADKWAEAIIAKSAGYPLYISFLLEDILNRLRSGHDNAADALASVIDGAPSPFDRYVEQCWSRLVQENSEHRSLLPLLTVARRALSRSEIVAIKGEMWRDRLDNLERSVARWVYRRRQDGQTYFSFAHDDLARLFRGARLFAGPASDAEDDLLAWAERHPSANPYAVAFLMDHYVDREDSQKAVSLSEDLTYIDERIKAIGFNKHRSSVDTSQVPLQVHLDLLDSMSEGIAKGSTWSWMVANYAGGTPLNAPARRQAAVQRGLMRTVPARFAASLGRCIGRKAPISCLLSVDGGFVSGHDDGSLWLWKAGKEPSALDPGTRRSYVGSLLSVDDGFVSGHDDGSLWLWDQNLAPCGPFWAQATAIAGDRNGVLAIGDARGEVARWRMTPTND